MKGFLDQEEQRFLLGLARRSIEEFLRSGKQLKPDPAGKKLLEKRGAFVSLKVKGHLRGCIGYPLPHKSLQETIIEMAVAAATKDYRFPSLLPEELPDTRIEISVLTLPQAVKNAQEVEVGRHGIIISKGLCKGLLLPQVPGEYNWDRETYLCHGCLKAGLDEDEWRRGAKIEVFEAQVISE